MSTDTNGEVKMTRDEETENNEKNTFLCPFYWLSVLILLANHSERKEPNVVPVFTSYSRQLWWQMRNRLTYSLHTSFVFLHSSYRAVFEQRSYGWLMDRINLMRQFVLAPSTDVFLSDFNFYWWKHRPVGRLAFPNIILDHLSHFPLPYLFTLP